MGTVVGGQDPGPSNQARLEDRSTTSMPEIEVMRDADPDIEVMRDAVHPEDIPSWIDPRDDKLEPDIAVMDEVMNENDNRTPNGELNFSNGSLPTQQHEEPFSVALEQEPENFGSHSVLGGFNVFLSLYVLYFNVFQFLCILYLYSFISKLTPFQWVSI